jgi:ABC-type nitrate/sulfonate/bicarbonate transport system substrate-binding protein
MTQINGSHNPMAETVTMKLRLSIVLALVASLLLFTGALSPAAAAEKVTLSMGATNDPAYLPFFVAIDKGYYKAQGLDVRPVYVGGAIAATGLISGAIDFSTSTGSAISAIIKGAKLKVVMTLSESPPWKLWVTDPKIRTLADLKGKSVGIQSRGDLFEMSMRALLIKHGMSGDAVSYVQLGYGSAQRLAVIRTHSLPAVLLTNLEERIARKDHLLGGAHMLVDISRVIHSPNNGLAVSDKLLARNPGLVERMLRGTLMAMHYIRNERTGALAILASHAKGVPASVLPGALDETATNFIDDGQASVDAWKSELAVRSGIVGLKRPPAPGTVVDYALVKKAVRYLKSNKLRYVE